MKSKQNDEKSATPAAVPAHGLELVRNGIVEVDEASDSEPVRKALRLSPKERMFIFAASAKGTAMVASMGTSD